jgi:hypothetical protein
MDISPGSTISAFRRHVIIYITRRSAFSSPEYVVVKTGNRAGITFKLRDSSLFVELKKNICSKD